MWYLHEKATDGEYLMYVPLVALIEVPQMRHYHKKLII